MGFKTSVLLTAASVLLASAPAFATTFTFESNKLPGSTAAGITKSIKTSYAKDTNLFTWSSTYQKNKSGALAEGLWLVANGGANPKDSNDGLAIYYLDGKEKKVSIYEYDGKNGSNSFHKPGNLLGSTTLDVLDNGNEKTFSFAFDTDDFNLSKVTNPDWKGTVFGQKVGLWVHGVTGLETAYNGENLTKFAYKSQSWYDSDYEDTTAVPEPASAAAVGLFAVAGAFVKRSKQSA